MVSSSSKDNNSKRTGKEEEASMAKEKAKMRKEKEKARTVAKIVTKARMVEKKEERSRQDRWKKSGSR